uniref:Uncharacterized protein n=1 Tax=Anopheles quadriannulatus TaxID=34691 RepID=A0A182XSR1_ANOQN
MVKLVSDQTPVCNLLLKRTGKGITKDTSLEARFPSQVCKTEKK